MKFLLFYLFLSSYTFANENDGNVEVINLHESKSLDQMVLDNLNGEQKIQEDVEELIVTEETETVEVEVTQIEIVKDHFVYKNDTKDIKNYFDNLQKIKSKALQKQIIQVLENLELNLENDQDKEKLFLIVEYLKSIGQINKSYELIERYDLSKDTNLNFYTKIKLNYLLSTFQLNEACNFKDELNSDIKLDYYFLENLTSFV